MPGLGLGAPSSAPPCTQREQGLVQPWEGPRTWGTRWCRCRDGLVFLFSTGTNHVRAYRPLGLQRSQDGNLFWPWLWRQDCAPGLTGQSYDKG